MIYLIKHTNGKHLFFEFVKERTIGYIDNKIEAEKTVTMLNHMYKDINNDFELIEVQKFNEKNMELF